LFKKDYGLYGYDKGVVLRVSINDLAGLRFVSSQWVACSTVKNNTDKN
jgi:hypothetical protein